MGNSTIKILKKIFKNKICLVIIFLLLVSLMQSSISTAQTILATVELELNALPDEKRQKLTEFKQILEEYFNNHQWTNDEFPGELPVNIQLLLEDISVSYEDRYKMPILISNNSDIQYSDRRCRMEYQKGEIPLHTDNNWDSLTSLLDFYLNILIGEEMDKYGHLLGTQYFEKAKIIAEQARFGMGQFIEGWDLRVELIQHILSDRNQKLREMKDFFFYGLYFKLEDPKKARTYCTESINMMEEIFAENNSKGEKRDKYISDKLEKFIQAHYIEIIDIFKNAENKDALQKMIAIDPSREKLYKDSL